MDIKTITCHDVYNVGASLQAYALQEYLTRLGHNVKIIDYKPDYLSTYYHIWGCSSPKYDKPILRTIYSCAKFPKRIINKYGKRKYEFDRFTKTYLNLTKRYTSNEELRNNPPIADVYFAGSDQIWNTLFENGKDPAFYLDFAPPKSIKASYAASFATDKIAYGYKDFVKKSISSLNYVSVREKQALTILENIEIKSATNVLDPVFLLSAEKWTDLSNEWNNPEKKPYILVYDFDNNKNIAEIARKIAQKNNLNIISILKNPYIKKDYSKEGPIAFLSLIKNAQMILSNSFHATAFSVIFQKQFLVFDRKEAINTRMNDFVGLIGCSNNSNVSDASNIDYSIVNIKLYEQQNHSKRYIDMVINGALK